MTVRENNAGNEEDVTVDAVKKICTMLKKVVTDPCEKIIRVMSLMRPCMLSSFFFFFSFFF